MGHHGLDDNHVIQERRYIEQVVSPGGELAVYTDVARVLFADGARLDDLADLGLGYVAFLRSFSGMDGLIGVGRDKRTCRASIGEGMVGCEDVGCGHA